MRIVIDEISIVDGPDIEVDIETRGGEAEAETVHMHIHDAAARAMQAIAEQNPPEECDGIGISVDWERRFEKIDEGDSG